MVSQSIKSKPINFYLPKNISCFYFFIHSFNVKRSLRELFTCKFPIISFIFVIHIKSRPNIFRNIVISSVNFTLCIIFNYFSQFSRLLSRCLYPLQERRCVKLDSTPDLWRADWHKNKNPQKLFEDECCQFRNSPHNNNNSLTDSRVGNSLGVAWYIACTLCI